MAGGRYLIILMFVVTQVVSGYGTSDRSGLSLIDSSPSGVTTFGRNDEQLSNEYLPPNHVYLINRMPTDGILYKVEPYFISTDPVFIQLWYLVNKTANAYKLVFQKEVKSDVAMAKKAFEFSTDYDNTCPLVNDDMFLGVWTPSTDKLPIGVYSRDLSTESLLSFGTEQPQMSETRTFSESTFTSKPDLKGYVYLEDGTARRRKRTPTAVCPSEEMSEPEPEETKTTELSIEPVSQPEMPATVSDHLTTTQDTGMMSDNRTSINKNVIYIISGVAAAVVFILILVITCCVMKRRRSAPPTVTITSPPTGDVKRVNKPHQKQTPGDGVHYPRTNLGYVPDQAAYERPSPTHQARADEYASMAPSVGVYEEIPDGDPKHGDTGQRSDGAYLEPVDQRYPSAGIYLHTTEPPKNAYLQVDRDSKHGGKVKDDARRGDQSPYCELEIDQNVGNYGHDAKR